MPALLQHLITQFASAIPQAEALACETQTLTHSALADRVSHAAIARVHGAAAGDRVRGEPAAKSDS